MSDQLTYEPPQVGLFHTTDPILSEKPDENGLRPILHGGMWQSQRAWWFLPNFIRLFVGGYGCVRGDTIIDGVPIAERAAGHVESLGGQAYATAGYRKGRAELYRVSTLRGREVFVTEAHRFLTPHGWLPLARLRRGSLIAGDVSERASGELRPSSGSRSSRPTMCHNDAESYLVDLVQGWDEIVDIQFDRFGDFYDIEVPEVEHYFAHGLVHHNSGKTLALCKRMVTLALQNAPIPVALVSPTYPVAKRTVVITLVELLDALKDWLAYWHQTGQKHARLEYKLLKTAPFEFQIQYHEQGKRSLSGTILVYSGEDPDKLKGPNLAAAGIDEPFIQEKEVFEQMVVRCRHPEAIRREVNLTGTPEQLNWGYDLAEGDMREKYDVGIVQASTLENRALPQDYLDSLQDAFDPKVAEAYLHGQFVNLAVGLVYYSFDRSDNVVEFPMPEDAELGVGMDFNVNPMSAVVFWVIKKGAQRHIHFFDEIELPNSDTQAMCAELAERYGAAGVKTPYCAKDERIICHRGLRMIYPDSNAGRSTAAPGGKTDYDFIREAGFTVDYSPSGNPNLRDRYNAVNNMLRANAGRVRMTVAPRCKKLIKYQMLYSHELKKKDTQKQMSHLLDARDYPVCRLFPASRENLKLTRVIGA